ncbi:MAG: bifunctional hydroxymethylpyrimidine kinase/phosphomethylpyrimidine kinase [Treponema sp.]|nr:bifunctional hydroxymethylpyrimidine kinase/phosphomethylpyrimidine kinase [Treponema sp.]
MKTALTIAGSDSCGGAGIQADIKTMTMNGVYAMSAITALTAQNTTGVFGIMEVTPDFLKKQLNAVISDIFPDAVKTGMVSSSSLIKTIAQTIKTYSLKNLVVDPVMVATSGSKLISEDAIQTLKTELLPLATLITPNIPEAECLLENSGLPSSEAAKNLKITSEKLMEDAAKKIYEMFGCAVLVKGGHNVNDASDFLYGKDSQGKMISKWFKGRRIENPNTHGTGCTLSSAIAANLAKGETLEVAVEKAKEYISGALEAMLNLGKGSGPLMHNYKIVK